MPEIPSFPMVNSSTELSELANKSRTILSLLLGNKLTFVGFLIVLTVVFAGVFAPVIAPYPGDAKGEVNFDQRLEPPSFAHPMGTDDAGRDILSRVIYGARISILAGILVVTIAAGIGVPLGLLAGMSNSNWMIMRGSDIFISIPPIVLAMAIISIIGPNLWVALIAVAVAWWPWYTRLIEGEVQSIKEEEFVLASEAAGAGKMHIMFREILPNLSSVISVKVTLDMGFVILVSAGLAFLGLEAQPPTPSWGAMIAQGRSDLTSSWWMATFPGLAISFTVLGLNLLGDGLRDILDTNVGVIE